MLAIHQTPLSVAVSWAHEGQCGPSHQDLMVTTLHAGEIDGSVLSQRGSMGNFDHYAYWNFDHYAKHLTIDLCTEFQLVQGVSNACLLNHQAGEAACQDSLLYL